MFTVFLYKGKLFLPERMFPNIGDTLVAASHMVSVSGRKQGRCEGVNIFPALFSLRFIVCHVKESQDPRILDKPKTEAVNVGQLVCTVQDTAQ